MKRGSELWRFRLGLLVVAASFGAFGCRKKSEPSAARQVPSAASSAATPAAGCRGISPTPFVISTTKTAPPPAKDLDAGPDDEEDDPLPFSVELGAARAFDGGFAVSGLRSEQGSTRAFAALLIGGASKLVELGVVHGDPEPPLLVAHGTHLFGLVLDSDAAGFVLRLGEIVDARANARFVPGAELSGIPMDASGFVADLSEGRGVFAYTAGKNKTAIFAGSFDSAALKAPLATHALALGADEASEPRIAPRKGGFWLAFVSEPPSKKPAKPQAGERDASDDEPEKLVELGPRELRIVSLDAAGTPQGEPRRVAPPTRQAFVFDLAAQGDAGAILLWQESRGGPGADGATIKLGKVRADGSMEQAAIEDDRLGAGVPALLHDPEPREPAGVLWLSAAGNDDLTLFGPVTASAGSLQSDPIVRGAALLAVNRGTFLTAQWRGQDVELKLVACTPALLPPAP